MRDQKYTLISHILLVLIRILSPNHKIYYLCQISIIVKYIDSIVRMEGWKVAERFRIYTLKCVALSCNFDPKVLGKKKYGCSSLLFLFPESRR